MLSAITIVIGFIMVVGVCNDVATLSQALTFALLGFALMIIAVLLCRYQDYYLVFVKPNGRHIKVRTHTLLGKLIVTHKYNKLGYKLHTEWEVS